MESLLNFLVEAGHFAVNFIILNVTFYFAMIGGAVVLIGLFMFIVVFYRTDQTYFTTGKIIGIIARPYIKKRKDGSTKVKYNYRIAVEFTTPYGELKRDTMTDWDSSYLSFKTGHPLDIKVTPSQAYDDIRPADKRPMIKAGMVIITIGLAIFLAATRSPWLWGALALVSLLFVVLVPIFLNQVDTSKQELPEFKRFTEAEIKDIESIAEQV